MIFVDACYRKPTPRPPVWMMRQAGRYLPEYREIRAKHGFMEMCANPEVAAEITLQPIRRFNMDAAIIFSDILLPLEFMGLDLSYQKGEGPVIANPIRTGADVAALRDPDLRTTMAYLPEALRLTRAGLPDDKALIGFAGAPFTLACYAVQGHGGKSFEFVRRWMFNETEAFDALLSQLADMTITHLRMQAEAGVQALQLFDSWGGLLSAYDYLHRVFPHVEKVLKGLADLDIPRILFVKNGAHLRNILSIAPAEVIGLDWTMPIEESRRLLGDNYAVQGNMDPMYLFAPPEKIRRRTHAMIELNNNQPGYIVNLGHGINKETPIDNVKAFIDTVLNYQPGKDG